jgi:signal transduction histidine kinase
VARRVVDAYEQAPDASRIRLAVPSEPVFGVWDPARLERALENLVGNALKYSPDDTSVCVTVAQTEEPDGEWATISVRDHGLGIPEEDLGEYSSPFNGLVMWRVVSAALG